MSAFGANRRFVPNRTGEATPLGHLERAVMAVIWRGRGPFSVSDVHAELQNSEGASAGAYTTVKTTMERLADKGILERTKNGKAYLYLAALSEQELGRRIVSATLDKLVSDFPQAVASFFHRPDPDMSEERLQLLKEAIEKQRENEEGKGPKEEA